MERRKVAMSDAERTNCRRISREKRERVLLLNPPLCQQERHRRLFSITVVCSKCKTEKRITNKYPRRIINHNPNRNTKEETNIDCEHNFEHICNDHNLVSRNSLICESWFKKEKKLVFIKTSEVGRVIEFLSIDENEKWKSGDYSLSDFYIQKSGESLRKRIQCVLYHGYCGLAPTRNNSKLLQDRLLEATLRFRLIEDAGEEKYYSFFESDKEKTKIYKEKFGLID